MNKTVHIQLKAYCFRAHPISWHPKVYTLGDLRVLWPVRYGMIGDGMGYLVFKRGTYRNGGHVSGAAPFGIVRRHSPVTAVRRCSRWTRTR